MAHRSRQRVWSRLGFSKSMESARLPRQLRKLLRSATDPDQRPQAGHDSRLLERQLHQVGRRIHPRWPWKGQGQALLSLALLWRRPRSLHPGQTALWPLPKLQDRNPQGHSPSSGRETKIFPGKRTMDPRPRWIAGPKVGPIRRPNGERQGHPRKRYPCPHPPIPPRRPRHRRRGRQTNSGT